MENSRENNGNNLETKKAKQSEERMKLEAEKCRKTAALATKEHGTMKEQYMNNLNLLKWTQNKLKAETEALGKLKPKLQTYNYRPLGFRERKRKEFEIDTRSQGSKRGDCSNSHQYTTNNFHISGSAS